MPLLSIAAYVSVLFFKVPTITLHVTTIHAHAFTHIGPTGNIHTVKNTMMINRIAKQIDANLCCDCSSTVREGGEGRAEMVVRVQAQDQSWVWLYMVLQLQPGEIPISSNNYIIRYVLPLLTAQDSLIWKKNTDFRKIARSTKLTPCISSFSFHLLVTLKLGQCVNSSAQNRPS